MLGNVPLHCIPIFLGSTSGATRTGSPLCTDADVPWPPYLASGTSAPLTPRLLAEGCSCSSTRPWVSYVVSFKACIPCPAPAGEHPQPPRGPQGSLSSPMALSHATLHQQHQQQQQQQALLHTGIYPIQEESSGALAQDTSTYSMQQQQQQQQLESMQYQQQQQPQAGLLPSVVHNPHLHASQQPQQQSSWEGAGPGVGPGGFGGPGGAAGGVGRGKGLKGMIREEDLRRRQEAAALAAQALAANTRVSDWQSKFAG